MRRAFKRDGLVALRAAITSDELNLLRRDCEARRRAMRCAEIIESDCVVDVVESLPDSSSAREDAQAYFAVRGGGPALQRLLLQKLAALAATALCDEGVGVHLFNEHFVVKPPGAGPFEWHTDGSHQLEALLALVDAPSETDEYVSVWIALDDIDDENGPLVLLPRSEPQPPAPWWLPASAATRRWLTQGERRCDLTTSGLEAGDCVLFSSQLWHRSRPNRAAADRRAYYAQFSRRPIVAGGGSTPLALAVRTEVPAEGSGEADGRVHDAMRLRRAARDRGGAAEEERGGPKRRRLRAEGEYNVADGR